MSEQRITLARYDSEAVESPLRYDAWRDNMGVFFDVAPTDDSGPRITQRTLMEAADLGGMVLARARAESQVFSRDLRRLRRDGLGLILVQYFTRGGGDIVGGDRLKPGDMQIVDSEQPYTLVASDYENLSLIVPYDQRDTISPVLETLHGRPIPGRDPMVRLLGDHLQSLWRNVPDMTPAQATTALQGTLGLLRGWLAAEPGLHGELLAVQSNNRIFGRTHIGLSDLAINIISSASLGLPMVKVSNAGYGGFVDGYGRILPGSISPLYERHFDVYELSLVGRETLFRRHGDWFAWVVAVVAIGGLVIRKKRARR